MNRGFKILDADIGRVAISDEAWAELGYDAWKIDPLEWTIKERRGDRFLASAVREDDTYEATFDEQGWSDGHGSFDVFFQLVKWRDEDSLISEERRETRELMQLTLINLALAFAGVRGSEIMMTDVLREEQTRFYPPRLYISRKAAELLRTHPQLQALDIHVQHRQLLA